MFDFFGGLGWLGAGSDVHKEKEGRKLDAGENMEVGTTWPPWTNHDWWCQALVTMRLEDVSIGEEDEDIALPFLLNTYLSSHIFLLSSVKCETEIWDLTYSCGHIAFNYSSSRHLLTLFRSSNKKSFSKPSYKVSKLFTSTESQSSMHDFYSIIRKITNFIIF